MGGWFRTSSHQTGLPVHQVAYLLYESTQVILSWLSVPKLTPDRLRAVEGFLAATCDLCKELPKKRELRAAGHPVSNLDIREVGDPITDCIALLTLVDRVLLDRYLRQRRTHDVALAQVAPLVRRAGSILALHVASLGRPDLARLPAGPS